MNGTEFVEMVREGEATPLRRLGSDKYLIAATEADLGAAPVLRSVALTATSGRDTFEAWAEVESGPAAETFATAAETEADHFERISAELDALAGSDAMTRSASASAAAASTDETGESGPASAVHRAIQSADDTVERAGAMVGRGLVADRTHLQVVNFFVNEGDSARADLARDLRSAANEQVEQAAALLETICTSDDDWVRAQDAAVSVIEAAYDAYADALEAMGVDPKPVC